MSWASLSENADFSKIDTAFLRPAVTIDGKEQGLTGVYYASKDFTGESFGKRVDKDIDFDRQQKAPDAFYIKEPVSIKWTGAIIPPVTGTYKLAFTYDDGAKISLGGKEVLNDFRVGAPRKKEFQCNMVQGEPVDILIEYFDCGGQAVAKLEWAIPGQEDENCLKDSIADCDAVIMVMGLDDNHTGEGRDKTYLDLPADQEQLIRKAYSINNNIALVLMNSTALTINWEDGNIPAILEAWYPGEKTGIALTDILWGKISPSGRLPLTFCKDVNDLPAFDNYDITNEHTYMYSTAEPLYEFGYGLSYTEFKYSKLKVNGKKFKQGNTIKAKLTIVNIGDFDADEVAQVYIKPIAVVATVKMPIKQLKGFKRVYIDAGNKVSVEIEIPVEQINYFNEATGKFELIEGEFELQVGASSKDIRLREIFKITK